MQSTADAVRSCITPVSALAGKKITTLAGLGTPEKPHPVQKAWLEEQVSQCGYCINGWIMTAAELLDRKPAPDRRADQGCAEGLICRCGTHAAPARGQARRRRLEGGAP